MALVATQTTLVVNPNSIRTFGKYKPGPSETTWGKQTGNRKRKGTSSTTPTPSLPKDEYSKTRNKIPPYIPPKPTDTPKFKIPKRTGAQLIAPWCPKE